MTTMKARFANKEQRFYYMMLSRLIEDAKYYINYKYEKSLWALNVEKHIEAMQVIYDYIIEKPLWCTEEQLNNYFNEMKKVKYNCN